MFEMFPLSNLNEFEHRTRPFYVPISSEPGSANCGQIRQLNLGSRTSFVPKSLQTTFMDARPNQPPQQPALTSSMINLCSGRCCECTRLGCRCDLLLTHGEWSCLKKEKARLQRKMEKNAEARMEAMARKTWLRNELAHLAGEKLEAA